MKEVIFLDEVVTVKGCMQFKLVSAVNFFSVRLYSNAFLLPLVNIAMRYLDVT